MAEADLLYLLSNPDFFDSIDSYPVEQKDFFQLASEKLPQWHIQRQSLWFHAYTPTCSYPDQGWKIHLSSGLTDSADVLGSAIQACRDSDTAFKFALDRRILTLLNSKNWSRGAAAKFITIYPSDEQVCQKLLDTLARLTGDQKGPYILSDRRYKNSAVVHYRYGGLRLIRELTHQGEYLPTLTDPEGRSVPDRRLPYFSLPAWVQDPFTEVSVQQKPDQPLLGEGRYTIDSVIAFSNSGGVYRGRRTSDSTNVIIKEARPLVHWAEGIGDATDLLKKEYRILSAIKEEKIAPEPYDLFADWEHHFLVEEPVEGMALSDYAARHNLVLRTRWNDRDRRAALKDFCAIFARIGTILSTLHQHNIVFGDLSPNNVIIKTEPLEIRFIDFEGAVQSGVDPSPAGFFTPGFGSRRQRAGRGPTSGDDIFALGALMFAYLLPVNNLFGVKPSVAECALRNIQRDFDVPAELIELILTHLSDNENARPALNETIALLERYGADVSKSGRAQKGAKQRSERGESESGNKNAGPYGRNAADLNAIMKGIGGAASYGRQDRIFPGHSKGFSTNHVGLAHGAAGIAYALKRVTGDVPAEIIHWVLQKRANDDLPAGLYLGQAGLGVMLAECGAVADANDAIARADSLCRSSNSCDLFYGRAGVGMAHLYLFSRTSDNKHLDQAMTLSTELLNLAESDGPTLFWKDHPPTDEVSLGFGHGASGIALFMLYLSCATGDRTILDAGKRALEFDLDRAVETRDRGISWTRTTSRQGASPLMPYIRYGSAGIVKVLIRYWAVTKHRRYLVLAKKAAIDLNRKYALFPGWCNGLAGIGDSLMDLYKFTGETQYLKQAERLADGIGIFSVSRGDGVIFPGDSLYRLSVDLATGSAGVALFLDRLRTNRAAPLMPDSLLAAKR